MQTTSRHVVLTRILPILAFVAFVPLHSASAQGPAPSQVRDVNDPPRASRLVKGSLVLNFPGDLPDQAVGVVTFTPALPPAKLLVIETITAKGAVSNGNDLLLTLFTNPGSAQNFIALGEVGSYTGGSTVVSTTQSVRLYSSTTPEGGLESVVAVNAQQIGDAPATGFVQVSITGFIVDP